MRKKVLFGFLVVLVIISMFGFVSAEMLISESGIEYEQRILDEFTKLEMNESISETWIKIFFRLKDASDKENVLSQFSEEEIKDIISHDISPEVVALKTTKEGFEKLIQDTKIKEVYYNAPVYAYNNEDKFMRLNNPYICWGIILIFLIILILIILKLKKKKRK